MNNDTADKLEKGSTVFLNSDQGEFKSGTEFTITRVLAIPKVGKTYITATDPKGRIASFDASFWELEAGKKKKAEKAESEETSDGDWDPIYAGEENDLAEQFRDFAPPGEISDLLYETMSEISTDTDLLDSAMEELKVARGVKWSSDDIARIFAIFCRDTGLELPDLVLEYNAAARGPSKSTEAPKRGPGRPPKEPTEAPKRSPGRPPKEPTEEPIKRGPGRPPKAETGMNLPLYLAGKILAVLAEFGGDFDTLEAAAGIVETALG